jgi:hypothetical protein
VWGNIYNKLSEGQSCDYNMMAYIKDGRSDKKWIRILKFPWRTLLAVFHLITFKLMICII